MACRVSCVVKLRKRYQLVRIQQWLMSRGHYHYAVAVIFMDAVAVVFMDAVAVVLMDNVRGLQKCSFAPTLAWTVKDLELLMSLPAHLQTLE